MLHAACVGAMANTGVACKTVFVSTLAVLRFVGRSRLLTRSIVCHACRESSASQTINSKEYDAAGHVHTTASFPV